MCKEHKVTEHAEWVCVAPKHEGHAHVFVKPDRIPPEVST